MGGEIKPQFRLCTQLGSLLEILSLSLCPSHVSHMHVRMRNSLTKEREKERKERKKKKKKKK